MPRMLDLFCGRFGWGKAFAAVGWEVVGIDLVRPQEIPDGCTFLAGDILSLRSDDMGWFMFNPSGGIVSLGEFDFVCASSPCEQFSVHGLKCFHPNPKYPEVGIRLFEHTRAECERSGTPYIMENVRAAQSFVGNAIAHAGAFYLWGNAVPARMPRERILKGMSLAGALTKKRKATMTKEEIRTFRLKHNVCYRTSSGSEERKALTAKHAEIHPKLAEAVVRAAQEPERRYRHVFQDVLFA